MEKNNIGDMLKQQRKTSGLSADQVVSCLKEYGIAIKAKTLYGYENHISMPNADVFIALCKIYNCNGIMDFFPDAADDTLFTNREWEILEKYRTLDNHGREMIDLALKHELKRTLTIRALENKLAQEELPPSNV